jgi:hypothetical protein
MDALDPLVTKPTASCRDGRRITIQRNDKSLCRDLRHKPLGMATATECPIDENLARLRPQVLNHLVGHDRDML